MITDPKVIRFSNEKCRVFADALYTVIRTAQALSLEYYADPTISDALNADANAVLDDGANADGRTVINANDVLNIITRASELKTDYEAGGNAKLNTVIKLNVNGQPKF